MAQIVRVVTPTENNTNSIVAFQDQLMNVHHWAGDYHVYPADDDNSKLANLAARALGDTPDVIVAAGAAAATILQGLTPTIPIIQAAGGEIPANKKSNLTGFYLNAKKIAQHHLDHLGAQEITVLYDDTNPPSRDVYKNLNPGAKHVTPLVISNPSDFGHPDPNKFKKGFMVIPNAMYYNHCKDIVDMVERQGIIEAIYYPEREYKDHHTPPHKNKAKVHGHDIPNTFRSAADYAYNILTGTFAVRSLPGFLEAIKYQDD